MNTQTLLKKVNLITALSAILIFIMMTASHAKSGRDSNQGRKPGHNYSWAQMIKTPLVSPEVLAALQAAMEDQQGVSLDAENVELVAEFDSENMNQGAFFSSGNADQFLNDHLAHGAFSLYNVQFDKYFDQKRKQGGIPFGMKNDWDSEQDWTFSSDPKIIAELGLNLRADWLGSAYYVVEFVMTPDLSGYGNHMDYYYINERFDYKGSKYGSANAGKYDLKNSDHKKQISVVTDAIKIEREYGNEWESAYNKYILECRSYDEAPVACKGLIHKVRVYQILY